jgi:hypothetical protein
MRGLRRTVRLVAVFTATLAFSPGGHGAVVDWLYDVDVPVADQSANERARGARDALVILLTRLTGDREPARREAVAQALRAPERYFMGYEYRSDPRRQPPLLLGVKFSSAAVRELISAAGLPTWSRSRPTVLVWLATDADGERRVVGSMDGSPIALALIDAARRRGLVLELPTMDPESEAEVATEAVWNRRWDALENAAFRYRAQSLLVGRITVTSTGRWLAEWAFRMLDAPSVGGVVRTTDARRTSVDVATPELAAAAGIETAVDELVARYAVADGPPADVPVTVSNAGGIPSYGALLEYLGTLDYIDAVRVDRVNRDSVTLRLRTRVQWPQLTDLLAIDARLVPADMDSSTGSGQSLNPSVLDARQLVWQRGPADTPDS